MHRLCDARLSTGRFRASTASIPGREDLVRDYSAQGSLCAVKTSQLTAASLAVTAVFLWAAEDCAGDWGWQMVGCCDMLKPAEKRETQMMLVLGETGVRCERVQGRVIVVVVVVAAVVAAHVAVAIVTVVVAVIVVVVAAAVVVAAVAVVAAVVEAGHRSECRWKAYPFDGGSSPGGYVADAELDNHQRQHLQQQQHRQQLLQLRQLWALTVRWDTVRGRCEHGSCSSRRGPWGQEPRAVPCAPCVTHAAISRRAKRPADLRPECLGFVLGAVEATTRPCQQGRCLCAPGWERWLVTPARPRVEAVESLSKSRTNARNGSVVTAIAWRGRGVKRPTRQ